MGLSVKEAGLESRNCAGLGRQVRLINGMPLALAVGDVAAFAGAALLHRWLAQEGGSSPAVGAGGTALLLLSILLSLLLARASCGSYALPLRGRPATLAGEAAAIFGAVGVTWGLALAVLMPGPPEATQSGLAAIAAFAALGAASAYLVGSFALAQLGDRAVAQRVLLVSAEGHEDAAALRLLPFGPTTLAGRVDIARHDAPAEAARLLREAEIAHLLLVPAPRAEASLASLLPTLAELDVRVWLVRRYGGLSPDRAVLLRAPSLPPFGSAAKRALDIAMAASALLLLAPVLLGVALAIRLDSPGPVLFRQIRQGRNGRDFSMLKFRSMSADASDPAARRLTARADPRVTRVGRFIRRTSIDELPQLVNVLRGEMSIVGPRPLPPGFSHQGVSFEEAIPAFRARFAVKPGITGLAQLRGQRGTPEDPAAAVQAIAERIGSDLEYIDRWSFALDLRILLATVLRGAWLSKAY